MLKRLWWLVIGFVLGLGSSYAVSRRLRRVVARYAPAEVVDRWSTQAQALGRDAREAFSVGRDAMRAREAELRDGFERPASLSNGTGAVAPSAQGVREAGK